jgi:hypothetical protein
MQNAKDTFYVTLRDRLAALNPARTVVMRGAIRPALLVQENELEGSEAMPADAFVMVWKEVATDNSEAMPLCWAVCELHYATRGTVELAGLDRGRVLDAMDCELRAMLEPRHGMKQRFDVDPAETMATEIFWSEAEFRATTRHGDRIGRIATVTLFALREAEEA